MKIKRVLAGGLAALATGATLTLGIFAAGLGDYVQTSGSSLTSPVIVIGAPQTPTSGYPLDVVGAADIAAAVAGYAATTVPVSGSTASVGVTGGADLSSSSRKLYMGSLINEAKTTLTAQDLPTVLKSGKVSVSGVDYKYDQYINIGGRQVVFNKPGGSGDPVTYVDIGTNELTPVYNSTVVFSKALNVSASSVQGKKITMFGTDFTIGSQSDVYTGGTTNNKLELFGFGQSLLLEGGGAAQTVSIGGVDHTVKLEFVATTSGGTAEAYITVDDSDSDSFAEGESGVLGGINLYVKNVWAIQNTLGKAEVSFGSSKLTLLHGSEVKYGESDTPIDNTLVEITGDNAGISKVVVSVSAKDDASSFASKDTPFVDPVWGTFKVAFNGVTPEETSAARDLVTADNSGTGSATLKVTDYRGNEKTLTFAFTSSSSYNPMLNETSSRQYHVAEGETVLKNDYFLVTPLQESEFSHLYQLSAVSSVGSASATVQITDVFTGDATTIYLTDAVTGLGYGTQSYSGKAFYIDGQTFYVAVPGGTGSGANQTAKFFWGAGVTTTSPVTPGTYQTVFPLVKLQGGEYFSLTSATAVYDPEVRVNSSATVYYPKLFELPTGVLNLTKVVGGPGGILLNGVNATLDTASANYATVTIGAVTYNVTFNSSAYIIAGVSTIKLANTYYASTPDTNNPNRVGVLVLEQQNNATVKNAVILSISKDSSSYVIVAAPKFSGLTYPASGVTLESDTTVTEYLDDYGTFTWHDSESQGLAKVYYPGAQAIATVAIGPDPQFAVAAGAGTVQSAVKITSPVAKLASEVSTTSLASDLILVGGPCVNTLVAQLLGSDEQCSNWAHTTGIIKEVSNAFSSGHKALIVAGTLGTDTRALAAKVMQGTLTFSQ